MPPKSPAWTRGLPSTVVENTGVRVGLRVAPTRHCGTWQLKLLFSVDTVPPLGKQLWEAVSLQLEYQHLMFDPSLASGKTDGRSMLGTTVACRWERRMEKSEPGSLLNQVRLWSHPVAFVQPFAPPQSCKGMQRIENLLSRPCGTR